jgi:hypothetical protein
MTCKEELQLVIVEEYISGLAAVIGRVIKSVVGALFLNKSVRYCYSEKCINGRTL